MLVKLSVVGLYNYDNTLFDDMQLPEEIDKTVLIDSIFMESGDLPVLYPNVPLFKRLLARWSVRKCPQWQRYVNAATIEYNIIENYNRTEEETITREEDSESSVHNTGTQTVSGSGSQTGTITDAGSNEETARHTGTDTTTTDTTTETKETGTDTTDRTGTDTHVIARDYTKGNTGTQAMGKASADTKSATAFNSGTLATTEKVEYSGTDTRTDSLSETLDEDTTDTDTLNLKDKRTADLTTKTDLDGSDTRTVNLTDSLESETSNTRTLNTTDTNSQTRTDNLVQAETGSRSGEDVRQLHAFGNIGTLTSQQMLESEIALIPKLDVYEVIVNDFIDAFCLQIY